jgi:hypothetical protein
MKRLIKQFYSAYHFNRLRTKHSHHLFLKYPQSVFCPERERPRSLVETDRSFRGAYGWWRQWAPLKLRSILHNTRRNIPEDSHLHTHRRENLKSHLV